MTVETLQGQVDDLERRLNPLLTHPVFVKMAQGGPLAIPRGGFLIEGRHMIGGAPTDKQVMTWNTTLQRYEPQDLPAAVGNLVSPSTTVVAEQLSGQATDPGSASTYSRGDHTHGTPPGIVPSDHASLTNLDFASASHTGFIAADGSVDSTGQQAFNAGLFVPDSQNIALGNTGGAPDATIGSDGTNILIIPASGVDVVLNVDGNLTQGALAFGAAAGGDARLYWDNGGDRMRLDRPLAVIVGGVAPAAFAVEGRAEGISGDVPSGGISGFVILTGGVGGNTPVGGAVSVETRTTGGVSDTITGFEIDVTARRVGPVIMQGLDVTLHSHAAQVGAVTSAYWMQITADYAGNKPANVQGHIFNDIGHASITDVTVIDILPQTPGSGQLTNINQQGFTGDNFLNALTTFGSGTIGADYKGLGDSATEFDARRTSRSFAATKSGSGDMQLLPAEHTHAADTTYRVEIDTAGELFPVGAEVLATYKWSDTGGAPWDATLVPVHSLPKELQNAVKIAFTAGHFDLADRWDWVSIGTANQVSAFVADTTARRASVGDLRLLTNRIEDSGGTQRIALATSTPHITTTGDINRGAFYQDIGEIAVPANPAANVRRLFVDSATGKMSVRTNAGATVSLEGGGVSDVIGFAGAGATVAKGLTRYLGIGTANIYTTLPETDFYIPFACTMDKLHVWVGTPNNTNVASSVTIFKNGTGSVLAIVVAAGATGLHTDLVSPVSLAAGDRVSIQVLNQSTGGGNKDIIIESVSFELAL